ncbi:acyltransferase family protein [Leptospira adleri]|uniref:acyltransferase family protein n=1 Tax=Leptospira adleri TaxID=2023186 RepID=UPI00108418EA|nr:DUF5009 domain-containing protein [Leptospira adleri]TGM52901.1 DUF5009 domain-containing protein [Leptospira adleri]
MQKSEIKKKRILSLDLFRGMTVAGMILVNNPGSWSFIYAPLKHAKWNGCTPTDLVFPFFLFAVGASIPIAFDSKKEVSKVRIWILILKRSLVLFGIGLFLNFFGEWSFENLRIPGVLQRIAFVYFIVSSLYLFFIPRANKNGEFKNHSSWRKGIPEGFILFLSVIFLTVHTWILTNVVVPGESVISLEEGKDIGAWMDRILFGERHLWKFSKTWDPEGFFSGVASVASALLGAICGRILLSEDYRNGRILTLLSAGVLLTLGGIFWESFLPINKSLWTGSYAVYTGGLAFFCIFFFELLELLPLRTKMDRVISPEGVFQPFLVFGKNAILVFAASGLVARSLNLWMIAGENGKKISMKVFFYLKLNLFFNSYNASLAYALIQLFIWWGILSILDKKRIYLKV